LSYRSISVAYTAGKTVMRFDIWVKIFRICKHHLFLESFIAHELDVAEVEKLYQYLTAVENAKLKPT
jgi:hypothetical protein